MINNKNSGFVALISVIIISAVLLALTLSASTLQFTAREIAVNDELKQISLSLAEACEQIALLQSANNFTYTVPNGGQSFPVAANSCIINTITYGTENPSHQKYATTTVSAQYRGSYTTLNMETLLSDPAYAWPPGHNMIDVLSR